MRTSMDSTDSMDSMGTLGTLGTLVPILQLTPRHGQLHLSLEAAKLFIELQQFNQLQINPNSINKGAIRLHARTPQPYPWPW